MTEAGGCEYLQARLQARQGGRPDAAAWSHLEAIRELSPLLRFAADSPFRPWLAGITAETDIHAMEAALRQRWHDLVAEVARWSPDKWRPALRWWGLLPELPLLVHLLAGQAPLPWMAADPHWAGIAAAGTGEDFAALSGAIAGQESVDAAWLAEWRRRRPALDDDEAVLFAELERRLVEHAAAFRGAAVGDAWTLRRALQARLDSLFRRCLLSPAAAFVFLLQAALDLERLRGAIIRRRALPPLVPLVPAS